MSQAVNIDNLRQIVDEIAMIAGDNHGFILGGCVRDLIVGGKQPKDVDINFPNEADKDNFLVDIRSRTSISIVVKDFHKLRACNLYITTATKDNYSIAVDIVIRERVGGCEFYANGLIYDGRAVKHILDTDNSNRVLTAALEQVKDRILVPTPRFYREAGRQRRYYRKRIQKFLDRGWRLADDHLDEVRTLLVQATSVGSGDQTSSFNKTITGRDNLILTSADNVAATDLDQARQLQVQLKTLINRSW